MGATSLTATKHANQPVHTVVGRQDMVFEKYRMRALKLLNQYRHCLCSEDRLLAEMKMKYCEATQKNASAE